MLPLMIHFSPSSDGGPSSDDQRFNLPFELIAKEENRIVQNVKISGESQTRQATMIPGSKCLRIHVRVVIKRTRYR